MNCTSIPALVQDLIKRIKRSFKPNMQRRTPFSSLTIFFFFLRVEFCNLKTSDKDSDFGRGNFDILIIIIMCFEILE